MKLGSLFSGGGLGDFGFMAAGMDIAWQCEIDSYCQKILALRYPDSKKFTDIKTLKGESLEPVDIITGGFPCQPFSVAGQQMGKSDDRHLWPEMFRIIQEVRPRWVVGENVPGFIDMALDDVLANLESAGYETTTLIFSAHALGAWHRRERVWIVGHAGFLGQTQYEKQATGIKQSGQDVGNSNKPGSQGRNGEELCQNTNKRSVRSSGTSDVSDSTNAGAEGMRERKNATNEDVSNAGRIHGTGHAGKLEGETSERSFSELSLESGCEGFRRYWQSEPTVGRVANGIADRVHRLKMLGNGQVPACTYVIGKMIMEIENGTVSTL